MALTPGARLGVYEITASIGEGGMGQVYRATDTTLGRDVAIKILPDAFAADPERLARFEREAKTLASLNHPHIAAIYGFEKSSGAPALVMELVEGEDLSQRLARGAMPLDDALPVAKQIAEALEAAHEQGVVHRDLKPANVKLRPDGAVKVLDFGLAKVLGGDGGGGVATLLSNSPTIMNPAMTGAGIILGTAAYMSPDQAKGRPADRRSDLWAFGCVLYEMLTGGRAFAGDDVSDILAAVLRGEPDWRALPAETPASIQRLLRRCLEKDRRGRLADAASARLEIEDALAAPGAESVPTPAPHWTRSLLIGLTLAAAGALVAGLLVWAAVRRRAPAERPPTRLAVNLEPGIHLGEAPRDALLQQRPGLTAFALSPDGRQLVYVGHDGKTSQLYLRRLSQDRAVPIAGTTGAQSPFFSPAGDEVGFFATDREPRARDRDSEGAIIGVPVDSRGAIRRVALAGGSVRTIEISGPAPRVFPSASWSEDNMLLLAGTDGIYRLPAGGGTAEQLVAGAGRILRFPELLPGGGAILFNDWAPSSLPSGADIALETLDSHERKVLVRGGSFPRFVTPGHIVFARSGKLLAVAFDPATLSTRGDPVVVGEDVMQSEEGRAYFRNNGASQVAVSPSGDLAYVPGGVYAETTDLFAWVDRTGASTPLPLPPARRSAAVISPDGKRIAWAQGRQRIYAIWLFDVERGLSRRLTGEGGYLSPIWSRDGTKLAAVVTNDDASQALVVLDVDRGGAPRNVRLDIGGQTAAYWDSTNTVFLQRTTAGRSGRLATLTLDGANQVKPLFEWPSEMQYPAFSPDGKWMSYSVNETGAFEVYVRPLSSSAQPTRVSVNGGSSSAWSPDGRELYYREGPRMMAVSISTEPRFRQLGPPRELFSGDYMEASVPSRGFDITPDGRRFLMKARGPAVESAPVTSINVVLNWLEELKRLTSRN